MRRRSGRGHAQLFASESRPLHIARPKLDGIATSATRATRQRPEGEETRTDSRPLPHDWTEMRPLPRPLWQRSRSRPTFPFVTSATRAEARLSGRTTPVARSWSGRTISHATRLPNTVRGRSDGTGSLDKATEPETGRCPGEGAVAFSMAFPTA